MNIEKHKFVTCSKYLICILKILKLWEKLWTFNVYAYNEIQAETILTVCLIIKVDGEVPRGFVVLKEQFISIYRILIFYFSGCARVPVQTWRLSSVRPENPRWRGVTSSDQCLGFRKSQYSQHKNRKNKSFPAKLPKQPIKF